MPHVRSLAHTNEALVAAAVIGALAVVAAHVLADNIDPAARPRSISPA
ncbi:MAG TPA: hypothetical protein VFY79_12535 [Dehalococcoidia bacterium]|jgi:hypothetical protein|nr:hypothetical protein [Dehalococcoidia bacterium]